jgi:hypothetical protein
MLIIFSRENSQNTIKPKTSRFVIIVPVGWVGNKDDFVITALTVITVLCDRVVSIRPATGSQITTKQLRPGGMVGDRLDLHFLNTALFS